MAAQSPFGVAWPTESSRVRGSAKDPLGPWLGAFHRDRSRWKLRPNPIDSDTSCRRLVMPHWTELPRGTARSLELLSERDCLDVSISLSRVDRRPAVLRFCESAWVRAVSCVPPRRGALSTAPEVPSITASSPYRGLASFLPQPVPSLWRRWPAPFRSSLWTPAFDANWGTKRLGPT